MACHSLRHRGEELLGAVRGPDIPDVPWTSGIPLLHPWANRLGGFGYGFDGRIVAFGPSSRDIYLEEHGLPLHGLRNATGDWTVHEQSTQRLVAGRELTNLPEFPFDHRIEVAAELTDSTLTLTTTVTAIGGHPVPIAFGYHPYLQLPGVPRAEWELTLPVADRLMLDERLVPTGERAPAGDLDGPLGARTFDDGFTLDERRGPFVLQGGGRRIEVAFESGYPYAQIFAPEIADVICFEPMTAPADALRHSPDAIAPGESFSARFSVSVSPAA
jgi:galactose mutarotase-like enzyme